jgi:type IV pilus assembly protein PilM
MPKPTGVWGLDIGQCALKAMRLEVQDGRPTATAFDYIEHPKILSQPDADPDALTREALEKFLSRNPLGTDAVAIGIAGQSGLVRFVKLPPVEEKKIADIVKFEAKQQIPFALEEVVWDFQKIGGGEAVGGFSMETEIGLFAMKRDIINKHLGHYKAVNAEVATVQMAPLALCNYATYELLKKGGPDPAEGEGVPVEAGEEEGPKNKKRCAVVLDVGTDSSNLIITDGGKIIWQRPVPLGGSHFTRALTKEMKLTFAKAEHLKRNAAKSPDLPAILKALRPVLTEFVGEVQRSLGYFTNTHRDATIVYLVGLGSAFKLPGLQKYLAEKLSLDVRKPAKFDRLAGDPVLADPTFQDNLLTFPVAYGLALQGLGVARLRTNLIPKEVVVERQIRAKKPAVAAACAGLLLGTGVMALGNGLQYGAVTDPNIDKAKATAKSAIDAAKAQDGQHAAETAAIETGKGEVKAIVVGSDERLNWIRLQEVLVSALPRHGFIDGSGQEVAGTNLDLPEQVPLWNTQGGRAAYKKLQERLAEGIPFERLFDSDQSEHLAQVNVESLYCRWVDNLATFLTNADNDALRAQNRTIADDMLPDEREQDAEKNNRYKPKPPANAETGGWVIELRGSTSHLEGAAFLKKGLLRNIQRLNKFADDYNAAQRIDKVIPGGADPIKGKASHAFLLRVRRDDNPDPNRLRFYTASQIDRLAGGGTGMAMGPGGPGGMMPGGEGGGSPDGGMMPGGPPGMGGPAGGRWVPVVSRGSGGAAGGLGGMPGGLPGGLGEGGPGGMMGGLPGRGGGPGGEEGGGSPDGGEGFGGPPPGEGLGEGEGDPGSPGGLMPGGPGGMPGGPAATQPLVNGKKPRTEFVLVFLWKEETPTDPTPTADGSAAAPATGGP